MGTDETSEVSFKVSIGTNINDAPDTNSLAINASNIPSEPAPIITGPDSSTIPVLSAHTSINQVTDPLDNAPDTNLLAINDSDTHFELDTSTSRADSSTVSINSTLCEDCDSLECVECTNKIIDAIIKYEDSI